jgi:hypothetical protein
MRFLLFLSSFSLLASEALMPLGACPGSLSAVANAPAELALRARERKLVLSDLPEDIRSRMIAAHRGKLDVGKGDRIRGQIMTHWNVDGVRNLQLSGMSAMEVRQLVRERLDAFYRESRTLRLQNENADMSSAWAKLPSTDRSGDVEPGGLRNFMGAYNLKAVAEMKARAGGRSWDTVKELYYSGSLGDAFELARSVGDQDLQAEALRLILNFHNWEEARNAAEKLGSDDALLMIAKLELTDFLARSGNNPHHPNHIWNVIETLKRVQGPRKAEAELMLWDLARELSSKEFSRDMARVGYSEERLAENFDGYILRALRSMGTLVSREPIDSIKWNFRTQVSDPAVIGAIQKKVDRMMAENPWTRDYEEIWESLEAIGDRERLERYGDLILSLKTRPEAQKWNPVRFDHNARNFYMAGGHREKARALIRADLAKAVAESDDHDLSYALPRQALKMNDRQLLSEIRSALVQKVESGEQKAGGGNWSYHLEKFDELVEEGLPKRQAHVETDLQRIDRFLDDVAKSEESMREMLEGAKASSPEARAQAKAEAESILAKSGDLWQAYIQFAKARDREGLIRVADRMIETGNAFHAGHPLLAAALLPATKSLPAGAPAALRQPASAQ